MGAALFVIYGLPGGQVFTRRLRFANAEEMFIAANENLPLRNCGRRKNHLAERVSADHLVSRPGFDNERIAVFTGQKKLSVVSHSGSAEAFGHGDSSAFIFDLAGPGFDTGQNAFVSDEVDIIAVQDRRGDVSRAFVITPNHIRSARQVAGPT